MLKVVRNAAVGVILAAGMAFGQVAWEDMDLNTVSVSFPQRPKMKVSSESSPVGPITSQNYEVNGADYSLVVSTTRLPKVALAFRGAEALYKDAADALLKEHSGAQKVSYAAVNQGGTNGAELAFKTADGEQGKARFFLVGEKLMIAQATWKPQGQPLAQRFLDSFKVK